MKKVAGKKVKISHPPIVAENVTAVRQEKKGPLSKKLEQLDPELAEFLKTEDEELLDVDLAEIDGDDNEDSEHDSDFEVTDESEVEEAANDIEEAEEDDTDIVPMSDNDDDEEDEDGDDFGQAPEKKSRRASGKSEKTLEMSEIKNWSQALSIIMSGEAKKSGARGVIQQVVAALRCVADKMKPAEGNKSARGTRFKKNKSDENDEEIDEIPSKAKKNRFRDEKVFSEMFDYVGAREFHAVVKLCVSSMVPAILAMLEGAKPDVSGKSLPQRIQTIRKSTQWHQLKLSIRVYIETVTDLIRYTGDEDIATELLAHLNTQNAQLLIFAIPATRKQLIQTVVQKWAKGSVISSRELYKQCHEIIITIIKNCPTAKVLGLYERIFRRLYRAFVSTCKFNAKIADEHAYQTATVMRDHLASFVLATPVPAIAHSLTFVQIRRLCAQLRAAYSATSPETRTKSTKTVLSWPFLRCIDFWVQVIATSPEGHQVRQLVYPLTQLIMGTARLHSAPRYYPLRFHCINYLNRLASATNTFIPTLSLILDVFAISDFNAAASTKGTTKEGDERRVASLTHLLHFSECHMRDSGIEGGMLEAVVNDLLYYASFETLACYGHRIAFPELSLALLLRVKKFIKMCHASRFVDRMKILAQKIEENSRWIENRRRSSTDVHPANSAAVAAWESAARQAKPPVVLVFDRLKATRSIALKPKSGKDLKKNPSVKLEDVKDEKKTQKKKAFKAKSKRKFHGKKNFGKPKQLRREVA